MPRTVGVLAVQGDVEEHLASWRQCLTATDDEVRLVKEPSQLNGLDALSIPGGESTVIGSLAQRTGMLEKVKEAALNGLPILGTCAGMIFLSKRSSDSVVHDKTQPILGILDIEVERNYFGRQPQSFERDLEIQVLGPKPYHAVFIRAPIVKKIGPQVESLAQTEEGIVAVRQGNLLATSFHPELSGDLRLHRYFLEHIAGLSMG
ncbi:MAG: pyridoxal 5'-phosphate synthase glutaminase subunit PdxT [Thermoprotei archaeon]